VSAYGAGSGKIDLLAQGQRQRAAVQAASGAVAPAYAALLPQPTGSSAGRGSGERDSQAAGRDAVVLVAQNGSVFGIPAAHLTFEAAADGSAVAVVAGGEQCHVPAVERLVREQRQLDAGSSGGHDAGSALAVLPQGEQMQGKQKDGQQAQQAQQAQQCKPVDEGVCTAASLGVYPVQRHGISGLLLLPPGANGTAAESIQQQGQAADSSSRAGWLQIIAGAGFGAAASTVMLVLVVRQQRKRLAASEPQAGSSAASSSTAAGAAQHSSINGKGRRRGGSTGKKTQQMSNRLKGIMQQVASEGSTPPPAVSPTPAAAAGAGQLGERQFQAEQQSNQQPLQPPQQHRQNGQDELPSSEAVVAGLSDPAMRRRQVKDGVIHVGRMQVGRYIPCF